MTMEEALEEVKLSGWRDGVFTDDHIIFGFNGDLATAIATILNAVVKGEFAERNDIIESMCEDGFASVPFTITPPKPEIYNGRPHHAYKATCNETGNVYYGVTDETGYAELKLSSVNRVKGELK